MSATDTTYDNIIEIENLDKIFYAEQGAVTALHGINLSVRRGEIFGVIGQSGAGKSTLVRCINLLERPTRGRVVVDGEDMTALTPKELLHRRQSIGMIFQGFNLLMQRNALENICFPLRIAGVSASAARERAMELLEVVGLADRADAYPVQLSGGQKQRVAIARALAPNPQVLLCDEATSALDPATTGAILALLKEINQTFGITIVIITHEMSVVEKICHRVAILEDNTVHEIGRVEDVFLNPESAAARKLINPRTSSQEVFGEGRILRLSFDGRQVDRPIVAGMVLDCGAPVNILSADTRTIDGCTFGQMLIQLPDNDSAARRMERYLQEVGISYSEEDSLYVG